MEKALAAPFTAAAQWLTDRTVFVLVSFQVDDHRSCFWWKRILAKLLGPHIHNKNSHKKRFRRDTGADLIWMDLGMIKVEVCLNWSTTSTWYGANTIFFSFKIDVKDSHGCCKITGLDHVKIKKLWRYTISIKCEFVFAGTELSEKSELPVLIDDLEVDVSTIYDKTCNWSGMKQLFIRGGSLRQAI